MSSDPSKQASPKSVKASLSKISLGITTMILGVVLLTLAGCHHHKHHKSAEYGNNGRPKDAVTIFFSKYQGDHSIVDDVLRKLPPNAQNTPLQFALTELLKGPTTEEKSQGFYTEIPQGTKLLDVKQDKDSVTINLSKQFTSGGGSNSMNQRFEELKQTIFAQDSSHQIHLDVEGKPLELLGGEGLEVQDSLKRQPQ